LHPNTTDDDGRFRVSLPPGHYRVSLKGKKAGVGKYGPFEVNVAADTSVQWQCDSGPSVKEQPPNWLAANRANLRE